MDVTEAASLVDERMSEACVRHDIPTVSYGLILGGELVHIGALGDLEPGTAAATPFRIASMTKSFTAASVLQLRDAGVLSLDTPLREVLPWADAIGLPASAPAMRISHLLTMTAGFPTDDPWGDRHESTSIADFDALVAAGLTLCRPPGIDFEYANIGYALLGRVIAEATGSPYVDVVREQILEPLGMGSTTFDARAAQGRMIGMHPSAAGLVEQAEGQPGAFSPMGGLWSTVTDLATWVSWLDEANAGRDSGTGALRASSRREMQTMNTYLGASTLDGVAAPSGYGFGLLVRDDATLGLVAGHSGGLPGYGSNMRWKKGSGVGVIGLANVTYAPMTVFTHRALSALHDAGLVPGPSIQLAPELHQRCESLVALLNSWNDDAARALFADNVVLDDAFERRADEAARQLAGGRMEVTAIRPVNRTSGFIDVAAGSRRAVIEIALSPLGGLVQEYSWKDL